jgi:hypothetical protein
MHRNFMVERDRAVDAVVPQILDPACRSSLVFGKDHLGEPIGLLHAHAAISDRTHRLLEDFATGWERVVHYDVMPVGIKKFHLAEVAMGSRPLGESVIPNIHAIPIDLGRVDRVIRSP